MPLAAGWPELTLALTLTCVIAYLISEFVARAVQRMLRAIIADPSIEAIFVGQPRRIVHLGIFLVTAAALALPLLRLAGYSTGVGNSPQQLANWMLNSGLRVTLIFVAAYLVIRVGKAAGERFEEEMSLGSGLDVLERTKRAQTLSRMMQKATSIAVFGIAALMVLREMRVDITPVLTGAGIAGLAIGFGAQTVVRDVISGFFLILEDQVRVGDVAIVNGQGGLVEELNLRTIVLRDLEGTVHVFPNGEVKTLANKSKDFSFYVIDVSVSYEDNPARIEKAIRDAADSMMEDEHFRPNIMEPIEILGVDSFEAGHLVVRARIKTVPLKQWEVGRELRRRIADIFRERGIKIPTTTTMVRLAREKDVEKPVGAPERGRRHS